MNKIAHVAWDWHHDRKLQHLSLRDPEWNPKTTFIAGYMAALNDTRDLLRRAWEFPERPSAPDGEVMEAETLAKLDDWLQQWHRLNAEIKAALGD